jgi:hypothetical protein
MKVTEIDRPLLRNSIDQERAAAMALARERAIKTMERGQETDRLCSAGYNFLSDTLAGRVASKVLPRVVVLFLFRPLLFLAIYRRAHCRMYTLKLINQRPQ